MTLADGAGGVAVVVVGVVLVAPFVEELFFRGLLLRALWGRMGRTATVVVSAVLFGLAHVQLLQLPALVAFGLVAGVLVVSTKRLAPAMWAHAAFTASRSCSVALIDEPVHGVPPPRTEGVRPRGRDVAVLQRRLRSRASWGLLFVFWQMRPDLLFSNTTRPGATWPPRLGAGVPAGTTCCRRAG